MRQLLQGFNSLQTGRNTRTQEEKDFWMAKYNEFQFPSNGKEHANKRYGILALGTLDWVSIPFKREGTCEQNNPNTVIDGKVESFNSLQTGRNIRTLRLVVKQGRFFCVSIPFKREGTFEHETVNETEQVVKFQFPSNGKAHSNSYREREKNSKRIVSIPFKREGTCEHDVAAIEKWIVAQFQFPSNGKAHANYIIWQVG